MSDVYTPEEFAQKLKMRGYVFHIADGRKYVNGTGKESFAEDDFEDAYRVLNTDPVGANHLYRADYDDEGMLYMEKKSGGLSVAYDRSLIRDRYET